MPLDPALAALADETYVLLTTFRKNGIGVPTPVWIGRDGDALVVTTDGNSGKAKRIRATRRVQLVACGRTGDVAEGATVVEATAEVLTDDASRASLNAVFEQKYQADFRRVLGAADARADRLPAVLRITA